MSAKKILFIAMSQSIHVARWIGQIADQGWELHLFPSMPTTQIHRELRNITVYQAVYGKHKVDPSVKRTGIHIPPISSYLTMLENLGRFRDFTRRAKHLSRVIEKLQPDLIHIIELQHAGYLFLEAQKYLSSKLPPLVITNWGNDTYLFGRLKDHREKVEALIQLTTYYDCECERDIRTARAMGMMAATWPVLPNSSGFDLEYAAKLRQVGKPSERNMIALKGYQNWAGRALFGLKALEFCVDELRQREYRIGIYSAQEDVAIAAELFTQKTGVPTEIIARVSHEEMLQLFGKARVYIGLNISDGVSTSMLEALVMGAFPVQSNTACADEWLVHGETGMIVPPDDPYEIAQGLQRALTDDNLVDRAAERNWLLAAERLDYKKNKAIVVAQYKKVLETP